MQQRIQPLRGILLAVAIILLAGCRLSIRETGTLSGHVKIGPLMPALREGEDPPTPSPETYATRQIVIYDARGNRELQRVVVGTDGQYRVELAAGVYTVDINHAGIDTAAELPAQIEIEPGQTIQLDIEIDTGIR